MREPIATPREVARELARKYSTMTHEELDVLESVLVPMKFSKGEIILREGEVCRNIYYVERGLIRQFYFKNGKQITEHLGVDHTIFMCIESLFHEEPTHLQVEALEASYIYALPKHRLEQVALHNVNIQILFRKILEESLVISQVMADLVRFETAQALPQVLHTGATDRPPRTPGLCGQFSPDDAGDAEPRTQQYPARLAPSGGGRAPGRAPERWGAARALYKLGRENKV